MNLDPSSAPPPPTDQAASYRAARARLMGRMVVAPVVVKSEPVAAPVVPKGPQWSTPRVVPVGWVGYLQRLRAEVAHDHGISAHTIAGPLRIGRYVVARQEFCYRAMAETAASMTAIGRLIGGRDHSTVLSGAGHHARKRGLEPPRQSESVMFVRDPRAESQK